MVYAISFTLSGEQAEYQNFVNTIQTLGPWAHRLVNNYVVETSLTPVQVRDILKPHLKPGDRLFVAEMIQNWAASGIPEDFGNWLKRRNFRTPVVAPTSGEAG
jgi:hypothetical protein